MEQAGGVRAHAEGPSRRAVRHRASRRARPEARDVLGIRRVKILGCGSAYYAGLAGAHLLESLTRIPADAEPASEFRYRNPVVEPDVLYVAVEPVGRDGGHAGGRARDPAQGRARPRDRERRGQHDRARVRRRHLPARGARGLGVLDQVVHHARSPRSRSWPCTSAASATSLPAAARGWCRRWSDSRADRGGARRRRTPSGRSPSRSRSAPARSSSGARAGSRWRSRAPRS